MSAFLAILGIIGSLAPLMAKIGLYFMDKSGASDAAKQKFLEDFTAMQAKPDASLQARLTAYQANQDADAWEKAQDAAKANSKA